MADWCEFRLRAASAAAAMLAVFAGPPALAYDCALQETCIDMETLPPTDVFDWPGLILDVRRFFDTDAKFYIVDAQEVRATLPYTIPRQEPFIQKTQVHIPDTYFATTDGRAGRQGSLLWPFVIAHEAAHVRQDSLGLISPQTTVFGSVVWTELYADFMAGFFIGRQFQLSPEEVREKLAAELRGFPSGDKRTRYYHGGPTLRLEAIAAGADFASDGGTLSDARGAAVRATFAFAWRDLSVDD